MTVIRFEGFEWHDGWVASILRLDGGGIFVACAVAIDWNRHRFRFALCQISQEQAASLSDYYERTGFSSEFNQVWKCALSSVLVYLVDEEPREGGFFNFIESNEAERERLKSYSLPLVDLASSKMANQFWLHNE